MILIFHLLLILEILFLLYAQGYSFELFQLAQLFLALISLK